VGARPFRLGAWVGTDLFEDRLKSHQCGCDLARNARGREDRKALEAQAAAQQRAWQCPNAGHSGEADDPTSVVLLDAMAELTGVERGCLRTCPRWHATRPEITRAVTYRRYVEAGCPEAIDENPPVALIRAAHIVAAADSDRMTTEREEREAKRGG